MALSRARSYFQILASSKELPFVKAMMMGFVQLILQGGHGLNT